MRRRLAVAVLMLAAAAPAAGAAPLGSTVLVDRPSGFGALPFDGIGESIVSPHSLSADGRYAVFSSQSSVLLPGAEKSATNVYRVDLQTGALVQVDRTAAGAQPTPGSHNDEASISADGSKVGFRTDSPALASGAGPNTPQFVVKDLLTGALELASRANGANGAPVTGTQFAILSGDGRHVAFTARSAVQADNATGVPGTADAYLRSLDTGTTHMMSVTGSGAEGGGVINPPDIDYAGDAVAFLTNNSLVPTDTDQGGDAYIHVLGSPEQTLLASFSIGQTPGADGASEIAIAGGVATGFDVAWTNNGSEDWLTLCSATSCATPASQIDHARTGGSDTQDNQAPFFPPEGGPSLPARVYWNSGSPLDPADTNNSEDLYGWDIGNTSFDTSIHLMTSGTERGGATGVAATDDGSVTVFTSSSVGLPGSDGILAQAFVRRAGVDTNISQPLGRPPRVDAAGFAFVNPLHATSDDGRLVAFSSNATAFGSPVLAGAPPNQALVRDIASGRTQLLSVATDGRSAGNGDSGSPSLDAAGDKAVFASSASNLLPGDGNGSTDVFLRNLRTGTTTLVDRTAGGGFPLAGANSPEISADGRKVVFVSNSVDIPGAPVDGIQHVYEVDLATGDVTQVDRATSGAVANGNAGRVDIDGNGGRIAFVSQATNLGGGSESVYVRDLTNAARPTTTWVSVPQTGTPARDSAFEASIDRGGGRVAFGEVNAAFGFGMTSQSQIFVRDLLKHATTLASTGASGAGNGASGEPSLSGDGSRVAFTSTATNLPGALAGYPDVFVRDLRARKTVLASARNHSPSPGRFGSGSGGDSGSLSGNGECVAFDSNSDDLVAGGYGSILRHVFLHALGAACPPPPAISHLTVTNKRFAVGSRATAISAATRHGTTFIFTLSETATTRVVISSAVPGHRSARNRACKPLRRGQKRNCTRTITWVTLVRAHTVKGVNRIAFSGRFARRALQAGKYTATLTASDPAGDRSAPRTVTFTVL